MKLLKKLILVSGSPRRKQILEDAGFLFDVKVSNVDESFDPEIASYQIPEILSKRKVESEESYEAIILGADTVVIIEGEILNKPLNKAEAVSMLKKLSGKTHSVVTGVSIKIDGAVLSFSDEAKVRFSLLSEEEIEYYIEKYQPFDKAGSYGVQDFIGMIGIEHLEGSFYTVMGLPIHLVYQHLKPYILLN